MDGANDTQPDGESGKTQPDGRPRKITDARMEQLEGQKDEIRKKIENSRKEKEGLLNSMNPDTRKLLSSSARRAQAKRNKDISDTSMGDEIDVEQPTVKQLEEELAEVEQELADLKDMMGKS